MALFIYPGPEGRHVSKQDINGGANGAFSYGVSISQAIDF